MSEGTFRNGDTWNGHQFEEDGRWWFRATDKDGREYDTDEVPTRKPLFTMVQYVGSWTGEEVRASWAKDDVKS